MRTMETNIARRSIFHGAGKFLSLVTLTFVWASMSASPAIAQAKKGSGDLTTAATNPVASLIQLQLQDVYTPSSENASGYANNSR